VGVEKGIFAYNSEKNKFMFVIEGWGC